MIVFTITVPFGYFDPTFRRLAYTFFNPVCALESGPLLVNGLRLIFGHFCQPSVYAGSPFAVVLADATTATAEQSAATATSATTFVRTRP